MLSRYSLYRIRRCVSVAWRARSYITDMHELPVTMSILSIVLEQAKTVQASRIKSINLKIGELSGVVPEYVETQFEFLSKDTIAAGAALVFNQPPARLRCRVCASVFSPNGQNWVCPNCHDRNIEIVSGRECFVESMEIE